MEIERKLNALGLELPNLPQPIANYIGFVRVGSLMIIGGNIGRINGAPAQVQRKSWRRSKFGAGLRVGTLLCTQSPGYH